MNNWKPIKLKKDIKIFKHKNISIAYKYYNKKRNQKTILFLYGFGANIIMIDQFAPALTKLNYTILTFDYPGHGYSPKAKNISSELIIEFIIKLLKYLKEDRIILTGYSFGGILALQFYKEYHNKIDQFILIHSTYSFKENLYKRIIYNIFEVMLKKYYNFTMNNLAIPILRDIYFTKQQLKDARETSMKNDKQSVINMFKLIINKNMKDVLNIIDCPTLIIGSFIDLLVSFNISKKISKKIKNSRLKIFKLIGHYSIVSRPDVVAKEIDDFLKS